MEVVISLELVNTFGTLLTVAIIAATAVAAIVQLRHLRAGNQINSMLSISNQFNDKAFRDADLIVRQEVASALDDPLYRSYTLALARNEAPPTVPANYVEIRSAVVLVANTYEELGILVKNGIIDENIFLDRYCWYIARTWRSLENAVGFTRAAVGNNAIWENFEYLTALSQDWMVKHPSTYPAGVRRLQVHNPWPVPPMPATA